MSSIAILGAGAIGTYYGTRLALAGSDVRFLMRSERDHVRTHGVRLVQKSQTLTLAHPAVFGTTEEIGPVDLVLVTLKTTANDQLAAWLPPLLKPGTLVVTLQNGLGQEELLASLVGADRVLGGLCFIAATRTAPGEVTCYHPGSITLGEFGRAPQPRTQAVADLLNGAGIKTLVVESLAEARWRKLVWNVPFNGLTIAAGAVTTDVICADPALTAEVRALMKEVQAAAAAFGFAIPDVFLEKQYTVTPPMGPYQPSSLVDYRAGREVEVEPIWGEPVRRARAAGVATPRMEMLYALLGRLCRANAARG